MVQTSVFFRPDDRAADLVCLGTLYLARTKDRSLVYNLLVADEEAVETAVSLTNSEAMHSMLRALRPIIHDALHKSGFANFQEEFEIVDGLFNLLPTNLMHNVVEPYPSDDFFVRAIREAEEQRLKSENVVAGETVGC